LGEGPSVCAKLARMTDDEKTEPIPFPVEVTVNGVKVTVTLMLKPGTTVSVVENEQQETKEDQPQGET
jgi:hypothetical protein